MILGPDGKPCRVCGEFKSWVQSEKRAHTTARMSNADGTRNMGPGTANATDDATSATATTTTTSSSQSSSSAPLWGDREPETPCPPDGFELGQHTWTMLHTTAAYYPERDPTPQQQEAARGLMQSVGTLYPCDDCREHVAAYLQTHPPWTENRQRFSQWMCDLHNEVNARRGLPVFDCKRVLERWRESMDQARCG